MPLRICFIAAEVAPLAKTGGLADVAGALPRILHGRGHDVRVFMPWHGCMSPPDPVPVERAREVELRLGAHALRFSLFETRLPGSDVPLYLVRCPEVYDRATLYTEEPDEHLRFLVLQRAALEGCQRLVFAPDVVHCNDWHTALVPLLLKTTYAWDRLFAGTRTVLTIHNVGYQGVFPRGTLDDVGADLHTQVTPGAHVNWLREGIRHATRVSTVSPTYAWEICTPLGGHGLDEVLRARRDGVVGILNGVDYSAWNPATDRYLEHRYSATDLSGKTANKRQLLERMALSVGVDTPLVGVVSRMTVQKGFDLLFEALPELLTMRDFALAVLGSGEPRYQDFFVGLTRHFPDRVALHLGYDEALAHHIEAAADMFLMPSMYEPCGLNQLYSLKYGTVPIVRRTGGLADSVQMWDPVTRSGTGVVFEHFDANGVSWALHTALDLYKDRSAWRTLMRNGMAQDFSWDKQSREYERLYASALSGSTAHDAAG